MPRKDGALDLGKLWVQVGALTGIWWICDRGAHALALPVPGSVIGLFLLLALLLSGRLRVGWLDRGARGLLDHMVLFFVPALMALLNHRELLSMTGLKIIAVIVIGTALVMVGTALVVELYFSWKGNDAP